MQKCCERDVDGDGNCDRHPEQEVADRPEYVTNWGLVIVLVAFFACIALSIIFGPQ